MDYRIIIDPALGVNLGDIVAAWNEDPRTADLAEAEVETGQAVSYSPMIDPDMVQQGVLLLAGFVGGVTLDVVKDLLKEKIRANLARFTTSATEPGLTWQETPEGYLLVEPESDS